jgi:hypothetical protein
LESGLPGDERDEIQSLAEGQLWRRREGTGRMEKRVSGREIVSLEEERHKKMESKLADIDRWFSALAAC